MLHIIMCELMLSLAWLLYSLSIRVDYLYFSVSAAAQERSQRVLVNALTVEDSSDIEAVIKAKDLYQSCIDRDTISSYGAEPLLDVIRQTGKIEKPLIYI